MVKKTDPKFYEDPRVPKAPEVDIPKDVSLADNGTKTLDQLLAEKEALEIKMLKEQGIDATATQSATQAVQDVAFKSVGDIRPNPAINTLVPMEFSLEGLKQDFPQALELMQFIWDRTAQSIELRGLAPQAKYQYALSALQGRFNEIPGHLLQPNNPYISRNDIVPEDPLKGPDEFIRDGRLPPENQCIRVFGCTNFPHPFKDMGDRKVQVIYRRYSNGSISCEIEGPIERIAIGQKLNRNNQIIPDKYSFIDPRTGETAIRLGHDHYTPIGKKHHIFLTGPNGGGIFGLLDRDLSTDITISVSNPFA